MSRRIALTGHHGQGNFALVDDDDYERVNRYKWVLREDGYAKHTFWDKNTKTDSNVFLHRFIMNTPKGMATDHINLDRLDNRKSNLRICTRNQNAWNRKAAQNNTSGYKNVHWDKKNRKWRVSLVVNSKLYSGGYYESLLVAIAERNKLYDKLHGEFSNSH